MKPKGKGEIKMQVTSISLPDDLYRTLKHKAVDEGVSLRDLFEKALRLYLEKAKKGGGRHA